MEHIKTLLDKHEALKRKGLRLTNTDLFDWVWIMDWMLDFNVDYDSLVEELEDQYENDFDTQVILNKANWDTELLAKSKARQSLLDQKQTIRESKKIRNRTKNKAKVIEHYINMWKRVVK